MNNISVTPKGGSIASQLSGSDVNLTTPSLVKLNLNRSDIKSFARNGNDLVVTTNSGETVVIHNFYSPNGESDLVLQDDQGALWWVEDPGQPGFQFVSIDSTEGLLADNLTSDNTIAAFGIGGAALAGIAAMFAGSGGGGGDSSDATPAPGDGDNGGGTGGGDNGGGTGGGDNGGGDNGGGGDTTAPGAVTSLLISDNVGSIQGAITSGTVTDDNTPVLSGTAEAGATISVYDNGTLLGTVTVNADGSWSFTSPTLADGQHSLSVTVTDAAGNVSAPSDSTSFIVDTSVPAAASSLVITDDVGAVQGPLASGDTTDDNTPTLSGVAEAGATVAIYDGSQLLGSVTAGSDGSWSFTSPTLADGSHSFTTTVTDAAGNVSPASEAVVITILSDQQPGTPTLIVNDDRSGALVPLTNGASTGDNTPTLSGTAGANALVTIYNGDQLLGSVTAGANGQWSFTSATLTDGAYAFSATSTDAAGNITTTATVNVTIDTVAPEAAGGLQLSTDVDGTPVPNTSGIINDNTPIVNGTAEPGSTVIISDGDTVIGSVTVGSDGNWSFTTPPLSEGEHNISATVTDAAGNSSPATAPITVTVDTTPPLAASDLLLVDDSGVTVVPIPAGGSTPDTTPVLSGTAEAGSLVVISDNGEALGSVVAGAEGSWSFTAPELAEGGHSFTVVVTDSAGNPGAATAPLDFTVDITAPTPVTNLVVTDDVGDLQGPLASGDTTDDDTPTLSGQTEANAIVTIYDGSQPLGNVLADPNGSWSYTTPALSNGTHSFTTIVTDAAGNVSPASDAFDLTVAADLPPATVSLEVIDDAGNTLVTLADGASTRDTTPTLQGLTEAGALVTLYNGGEPLGSVLADGEGQWSFTPAALADGDYSFYATTQNATGNVTTTDTIGITVDTAVPVAPGDLLLSSDSSGELAPVTSGLTNDSTPVLSGTAEAGSLIVVSDGDSVLGSVVAGEDGSWSFTTPPLSQGEHSLTATATDAAGNESLASQPVTFSLDSIAPEAASELVLASDASGELLPITAGITSDVTPVLSGSAEANSIVTVYDGDSVLGSVTVDGDGSWSFTSPELAEGPHSLTTTVTDAAGNISGASPALDFTVDSVASQPVSGLQLASDASGELVPIVSGATTDTTPVLSGIADANSLVTISDGDVVLGSVTADGDGNWSFTTPELAEGAHSLTATATDAAGNVSGASAPITFDIDNTAPDAALNLVLSSDVGATLLPVAAGGSTNDATPVFSGTAEAGGIVAVTVDGTVVGSVVAAADGSWSFTLTDALAEGPHSLTTTVTDAAGNVGPASDPFAFTVDLTAPAAVTGIIVTDDVGDVQGQLASGDTTDDRTPTLSGQAEASSLVSIYDGDTLLGNAIVDTDGSWSFTTPTLSNGNHSLTVTVTDAAGNVGPASEAFTLTVDADIPPATSSLQLSYEDGSTVVQLPNGTLTNSDSPVLSGLADANSLVTLYDGDALLGSVTAGSNGQWTFALFSLTNGPHAFYATVTNASGIVTSTVTLNITVDTVAPAAANDLQLTNEAGSTPVTVADGGATSNAAPVLSGTAETGSIVTVSDSGAVLGSTTVDGSGNWRFDTPALSEGSHSLTTTVTDAAGNTGPASAPIDFVVDTIAPEAATAITANDNVGDVQGALVSGDTTDDSTPTLSGRAEPNSTVSLYDGDTLLGTATVDADGNWSFTTVALSNGLHSFTTVVTDAAGNSSLASLPLNLNVTADLPPATTTLQAADDSKAPLVALADGDSTSDTTPVLSGLASAGDLITLYNGDVVLGSVTADANGQWSFTPDALADNTYVFGATATDAAGNVSDLATLTLTIDTLAPEGASGVQLSDAGGGEIVSGDTTNTSAPVINGSAEPGSTVTVSDGTTVLGTTTVDGDGNWSFTAPTLTEGDHSLTTTVTDAAGNSSAPSAPIAITVDTLPPATAGNVQVSGDRDGTSVPVLSGGATSDTTPTISGSAEAGSVVTVSDGDTPLGSTTADDDGNWSFTAPELAEGDHSLSVIVTDAAGNSSAATTPIAVTVDTSAPDVADGLQLSSDDNGGAIDAGGVTNDPTPVLSGTAEAGAIVTVSDGDTVLGSTTAGIDGSWSFTTPALGEGDHSLTATVSDAAGNSSSASEPVLVTIDTMPPLVAGDLLLTNDATGTPVTAGGLTNDATPVLSGTADAGSLVTIYDGVDAIGSVTADGDGSWSFTTPTLGQGDHSLTATVTDAAGNVSEASEALGFTVDTEAPAVAADFVLSNDQGAPVAADGTTNATTPVFSGTAEPGGVVTIYDGDVTLGSAAVDGDGNWSFTSPTLDAGEHSFTTTVTDAAGNIGPASPAFGFTVDLTPPEAVADLALSNDEGATPVAVAAGGATNDVTPVLSGTTDAGSVVTVSDGDTVLGSVTAGGDGAWSFDLPTLSEGDHSLSVVVTNTTGNSSEPSDPFVFTIDTTAPVAATGVQLNGADNGPAIGAGGATNVTTPVLSGNAEPGSVVTVADGDTVLGTATTDGDGNWSFTTPTLAEGDHSLTATVTDVAGNSSAATTPYTFNVDTTVPASADNVQLSNNEGGTLTAIDDFTNDNTPELAGTAEAGSIITVYDGDEVLGSVATDASGNWNFTTGILPDGDHSLSVTVTDAAGNSSDNSAPIAFTVDTEVPLAPAAPLLTNDVSGATIAAGGITNDNTPVLSGTTEAGNIVTVYDGGTLLGSAVADGDGAWSFTSPTLLDGDHSLTLTLTDAAGNTGPASDPVTFSVDTLAPATVTDLALSDSNGDAIADGALTNDNTPVLSGIAELGSVISVYEGDTLLGSVAAGPDGSWSLATVALDDGAHTFSVSVADAAGNVSAASTISLVLDATAPEASTASLIADNSGAAVDITSGDITNDTTPLFSGTAEANSVVTIYDGDTALGSLTVGGNGQWSYAVPALADGAHSLYVTVTDVAGNTSEASTAVDFTINTEVPTDSTLTVSNDNNGAPTEVAAGAYTSDNTPLLSGTAAPGALVTIYDNGAIIGSVTTDADSGDWTFSTPTLADGSHNLSTTVTDQHGNVSDPTDGYGFNVDVTVPEPATSLLLQNNLNATQPVTIANGGITNDDTPLLSGTAEANSIVTVYDGDTLLGSTTANGAGSWSYETTTLVEGDHTLSVTVTDAAGNTSVTSSVTVTVDTSVPAAVTDFAIYNNNGSAPLAIANNGYTNDTTPLLRGSAEAGATVNISLDGALVGTATVAQDGSWSYQAGGDAGLTDALHSFSVTVTGAAGNTSAPVTSAINIDTVAPAAVTTFTVTDNAGDVAGPLTSGAITDDNTPTLSGTAEVGSTVSVYDGSTLLGTVVATTGNWSFTPEQPLSNAGHSFTVTVTDAAGNVSAASPAFDITVENGLPPATTTLEIFNDNGSSLVALTDGGATNDATPLLSGVATQGDVLFILNGDVELGSVTVTDANGVWSFTPAAPLADGTYAFSIAPANETGNVGTPTDTVTITIDTAIPAAAVDLALSNDNGGTLVAIADGAVTSDATPLLTGAAEAGALITVYDGDSVIGSATADDAGGWSFASPTLTNGAHALSVTVTDEAGNLSDRSAAISFTVDNIAPAAAANLVVTNDAANLVVPNGGSTNDTTPVLSGSAEANSLITVYDGTAAIGSTTAGADGAWSFTTSALGQGLHTLSVRVTDAAGNVSAASSTARVTVDTTAPEAVTLAASNNNGATATPVADGGITNDTTPLLTGTAEAGSIIRISDGDTLLGSVTAGSNGQWSFITPTLAGGLHTLTAIATDAAGNSSPATTLTLTVSTAIPTPVTDLVVSDNVGSIQGPLANNAFTDDNTPTLSGTTTANYVVNIYDGGALIGSTTANADGTWSFTTAALSNGGHALSVTVTDAAGNTSAFTSPFNLTVDTVAPTASTLVVTNDTANVVVPNGAATSDSTPVLSGVAESGSVVTIVDGDLTLGSTIVDGSGNWTFTSPTLADGSHTLRVTVADVAGNVSGATTATLIVDTTAPAAVTLAASNNNGTTPVAIAANGSTNDSTPLLTGSAEAGSRVIISDGATVLGSATAGSNGQWSFVTPTLAEGAHTLSVTATDAVGNVSTPTTLALNVDTTPPAAASILTVIDNVGAIQGQLANGGFTDDNTPTLNGTAEVGATVIISEGSTLLGSVVAGADGAWSFTTAALSNGPHTLSVTARDAAGNTSGATSFNLTVDTVAPTASTLTVTSDVTTPNVTVPNGGSTNDSTPVLSGSAEANSLVTFYDGTTVLGSVTASASGSWSFTPAALTDGSHTLNVRVSDAAGNVSGASTATVIVDTTPPAAVTNLTASNNNGSSPVTIANGAITNDNTPLLSGSGEVGARINVYDGTSLLGTTTVGSNGQWSFVTSALSNGPHTLNVTATDAVGNTGPNAALTLTVDTIAPAASTLTITNDSVTPTVTVPSGGATRDTTPVLSGTAEAGALVRIYDGATLLGSVTTSSDGAWSFTTATLTQGTHPLSVTVTDPAGNVSGATSASVVIDTVAPTAVTGLAINTAGTTLTGSGEAGATVTVRDAGGNAIGSATVAANGSFSVALTTAQTTGATLSVTQADRAGNVSPAATVLGAIRVVAANDVTEVDYTTQTGTITNANTSHSGVSLLSVNLGGAVTLDVLQSANAYQFSVGAGDTRTVTLYASATSLVALTSVYTLYLYQQQANGTWVVKSSNANYISTFLTIGTQTGGNVTYSNLGTGNYAVLLGTSTGVGVLPSTNITTTSDITTLAVTVAATVTGNLLANDTSSVAGTIPAGTLVTTVGNSAIAATGNTVINTTYGTLTVNAQGNYTYALKAGLDADTVPATDVFTYSVRDASGAVTSATLTVDLHNGPATTLFAATSLFAETSLEEGTTASGSIYGDSTAAHSGTLSITNEAGLTTTVSSSGSTLVAGDYGTLTITADGHYTYALNSAVNVQEITHKEVFSYSLTAADGTITTNSFTIELHPTITGTASTDALTSSAYDDTITAGAGADTLVYHLLNSADAVGGNGHDTWTDFSVADGDKIDVSSLLVGWNDATSNVNDFVKVDHTADGNTVLSIDRDGTGTAYSSTQLVTLEGVNVSLEELLQQPHQNPTV